MKQNRPRATTDIPWPQGLPAARAQIGDWGNDGEVCRLHYSAGRHACDRVLARTEPQPVELAQRSHERLARNLPGVVTALREPERAPCTGHVGIVQSPHRALHILIPKR